MSTTAERAKQEIQNEMFRIDSETKKLYDEIDALKWKRDGLIFAMQAIKVNEVSEPENDSPDGKDSPLANDSPIASPLIGIREAICDYLRLNGPAKTNEIQKQLPLQYNLDTMSTNIGGSIQNVLYDLKKAKKIRKIGKAWRLN